MPKLEHAVVVEMEPGWGYGVRSTESLEKLRKAAKETLKKDPTNPDALRIIDQVDTGLAQVDTV